MTSTVNATCLNTATPLAVGVYAGVLAAATATIAGTCTNTTPYAAGLGAGQSTNATVTTRAMTGVAPTVLSYLLSFGAAHAVKWRITPATGAVAGTGNRAAQPIIVYGQEAAGQYVALGAYTDTFTATY